MRGQRLRLTDFEGGVEFDLNADGYAERISWTSAQSDDAFLALDRDGNGVIQDGGELFGDVAPQPPSEAPNGFLALAVYDQPVNGGNGDGRISASDSVFEDLKLWIDSNHNGVTDSGEMITIREGGIESISLDYWETPRVDRYGNQFRYIGLVNMERGRSGPQHRFAIDVIFVTESTFY